MWPRNASVLPSRSDSRCSLLLSQDLLHGPAFRQLIDQLVQVPDIAHERILDLLDSHAADDTGDPAGVRMQRWRFAEERREIRFSLNVLRQRPRGVACQPADDFVHLLPGASLGLGFPDVVRIYAGKGCGEDTMLLHGFDGWR